VQKKKLELVLEQRLEQELENVAENDLVNATGTSSCRQAYAQKRIGT
jgi:hypothetical protein